MNYLISKAKIPQTESWPIKTSVIERILAESKIDKGKIISIKYLRKQREGHVFESLLRGSKNKVFANPGKLSITVYSVDSIKRKESEIRLIDYLKKNFIIWLDKIEENNDDWCNESQSFHVWLD